MKLLRYGPVGREKPGLLDSAGTIRDLSGRISDLTPDQLSAAKLATLAAIDPKTLPAVEGKPRMGVPVSGVRKFIAIGLNYADHAAEANLPLPPEPVIFMKAITCLNGPNDEVMLPKDSVKADWEVELGIVIGRTARYIEEAQALSYVAGFVLVNDVSEREFQLHRGGTWDKGKGCDTFGPVGPWLVCKQELTDPQAVDLWLEVNGRRYQHGNTSNMFFSVPYLVSYVSRFMTLEPGDLLATGTPAGVGANQKPEPLYLRAGDEMSLGSSWLGAQHHRVIAR
jgi:2,4-didehydro-3-deoxy-L-rhamnonate hydrolase